MLENRKAQAEFAEAVNLACGAQGQLQYRFDQVRRWKFDIAFPGELVAVEIQGGLFAGGAHGRGARILADMERWNEAQVAGWIVILTTPRNLCDAETLAMTVRAIQLSRQRAAEAWPQDSYTLPADDMASHRAATLADETF